jgi:hypothetical protein
MTETRQATQHDDTFGKVCQQNVRWLRGHFFKLGSIRDEPIAVNKLIDDEPNRKQYLMERFERLTLGEVNELQKELSVSDIKDKIVLLIFASRDAKDTIEQKMQSIKRENSREVYCGLTMSFDELSTKMDDLENNETLVVYLANSASDRVDDIKVKISYVIGRFQKDNVVVFREDCSEYDEIGTFLCDAGVACERFELFEAVSTLEESS